MDPAIREVTLEIERAESVLRSLQTLCKHPTGSIVDDGDSITCADCALILWNRHRSCRSHSPGGYTLPEQSSISSEYADWSVRRNAASRTLMNHQASCGHPKRVIAYDDSMDTYPQCDRCGLGWDEVERQRATP